MVRLVGRAGGAKSPVESVLVRLGVDGLEEGSGGAVYVAVDIMAVE